MKNLYVIPTDKPSRLRYNLSNVLVFTEELYRDYGKEANQNIYITSDEEIKEGDWYYWTVTNSVQKAKKDNLKRLPKISDGSHKIILTTDQDLINDGIQSIDDGFLEWFVKNPSCEEVEVERSCLDETAFMYNIITYKIIIPQEEPKQYPIGGYAPGSYSCTCVTCKTGFMGDKRAVQCEPCAIQMTREEPKQETLEEIRNQEISEDYYPPKDLANAIWGSCFQYEDIENNNIREKVKNACFMIEKIYKIQELCKK